MCAMPTTLEQGVRVRRGEDREGERVSVVKREAKRQGRSGLGWLEGGGD
jgi:hypothetical protein